MNSKTNKKTALFYAVGGMGSQISWYMINNYLTLFYTDVVGLTANAISMIMLLARIWDMVNDPMMGMVVDRTHTKWGKYRPYIAIAPPFLALFNALTFTVWPLQGTKKVIMCLVCYILAGMAYTVLQVAINSIVTRLATNSQAKMNLITANQVGQRVIEILLSAIAMPMILFFSKSDVATGRGYLWTIVIFGLVSIPLSLLCVWKCKELPLENVLETTDTEKPQKQSVLKSCKAVLKNKQTMCVVLQVLIGGIGVSGRMSLLSYYVIYCMGSYKLVSPVYSIMTGFQLLGTLTIPFFTKKLGKKKYMISLMVIQAVGCFALYFGNASNIAFVLIVTAVLGFTLSFASVNYGMISDCVDYGEVQFKERDEAFSFSFLTFGVKFGTAIAGSVGVLLLSAIGYQAGAEQTVTVQHGINMIVNLLPALLICISIIPMLFYKLNNEKMAEVEQELAVRRKGNEK